MIERSIVADNLKEFQIQEYITSQLKNLGQSHIKLKKTPLGEKIIIYASRPGLIVGRKGQNIKKLTIDLKEKFHLENPQIEINEVETPNLDAQIVAERIASNLERFGTNRFKGIGHKVMSDVMSSGALGVELLLSGKIPSSRARRWRFYQGYLKKSGDIALTGVDTSYAVAGLKTGIVGIQVRIMPPTTMVPDNITVLDEPIEIVEEIIPEKKEKPKPKSKPRAKPKKTVAKKVAKPVEAKVEKAEVKVEEKVEEKVEKTEDKTETKVEEKVEKTDATDNKKE